MRRKGWFIIPGEQDGDRTIEEQILALKPALDEARGKDVLDMGCAEGLIGIQFIRAGAHRSHGMDSVDGHLQVAKRLCAGLPMTFELANLNVDAERIMRSDAPGGYDIVLALGVLHKLRDPEVGVRFAAWSSRDLVLIRSGRGERDGRIYSKHYKVVSCDARSLLTEGGFVLEKIVAGPLARKESVEYWRRMT